MCLQTLARARFPGPIGLYSDYDYKYPLASFQGLWGSIKHTSQYVSGFVTYHFNAKLFQLTIKYEGRQEEECEWNLKRTQFKN